MAAWRVLAVKNCVPLVHEHPFGKGKLLANPEYQFERAQIGSLDCGIVRPADESAEIGSLTVFCHGFGAGGDDLVGLAPELLQIAPLPKPTLMLFPAAPLSLEDEGIPGGRAWWNLSIQRLVDALEEGRYESIREEEPAGIDAAREQLCETISTVLERHALNYDQLMLGGFSQGAMLSMDAACRGLPEPPGALCLFSGCLICERQWKPQVHRLSKTSILQSHGRIDPILPIQTGKWLTELLQAGGCEVDFIEFLGAHTIPFEAIEHAAKLMAEVGKPSAA